MNFLGNKVRGLREEKELKQKDMALLFSVGQNTWSQYENNERTPDLKLIKSIAEYFCVSIDFLLDLTDEVYNPREKEFIELIKIYSNLTQEQKKALIIDIKRKYS